MGQVLSTPVTSQVVQRNGNVRIMGAVSEMQGWRIQHEDAHIMDVSYLSVKDSARDRFDSLQGQKFHGQWIVGFFAVLDGHGGTQVSAKASEMLKKEMRKKLTEYADNLDKSPADILKAAFLQVDIDLTKDAGLDDNILANCGSTCTAALVLLDTRTPGSEEYVMHFANCGDSRSVLSRLADGGVECASDDHKPNNAGERARIEAAGGTVSGDEPARIDSQLAVSRAFGDFKYKTTSDPETHKVIAVPTYTTHRIPVDKANGYALCLACDGIFDVVKNEVLGKHITGHWEIKTDLGDICKFMLQHCLELQSRDNMTCMIIRFIDGIDYKDFDDELEPGNVATDSGDHEIGLKYQDFARVHGFESSNPSAKCNTCQRFLQNMQQCPCRQALYCTRACQKKNWKEHRKYCSAAPANGQKKK